jgi:hypothetical protein
MREQSFDLILADVSLPDGNALDFVLELRTRLSPLQMPLIAISASMDQLMTVQSLRVGANDCFAKPTPWPVFIAAVERMLVQPYIRPCEIDATAVTWVEGIIGTGFCLYCPELNLGLQGPDMDELRGRMSDRIREAAAKGELLPFVSHVKVSERLIKTILQPASAG